MATGRAGAGVLGQSLSGCIYARGAGDATGPEREPSCSKCRNICIRYSFRLTRQI